MPDRWTRTRLAALDEQIAASVAEDRPVSVRHVFYRMTDPRLGAPVEKTELGYRRIGRRLMGLRRSGAIPYGWVSDSTRTGWHVPAFDSPEDYVRASASGYRFDLWRDAEREVEVWCDRRVAAGRASQALGGRHPVSTARGNAAGDRPGGGGVPSAGRGLGARRSLFKRAATPH